MVCGHDVARIDVGMSKDPSDVYARSELLEGLVLAPAEQSDLTCPPEPAPDRQLAEPAGSGVVGTEGGGERDKSFQLVVGQVQRKFGAEAVALAMASNVRVSAFRSWPTSRGVGTGGR